MVYTSTITKVLISLALAAPAISLGVNVATFSGGTCEDDTFISPSLYWSEGGCVTFDIPVGKSLSVSTTDGAFTCADNQYAVLKVWQSSSNCGNIPDASIGALATTPTEGGCNIMPLRSARLQCQNNDGT